MVVDMGIWMSGQFRIDKGESCFMTVGVYYDVT